KQRLAPFIAELLELNGGSALSYVEPYAGGAGIAIELLLQNRVRRVYLNDVARPIYAFWWTVVNEAERLCRRVAAASLSITAERGSVGVWRPAVLRTRGWAISAVL